ncbi:MAG: GTPase HflX [Elusimicrobia bacterium]|nr:GTPase HflX [Elusimicrobiota bacterium]MDE2425853.1 GTPase HflX [Elusimicrobiota bacterium]
MPAPGASERVILVGVALKGRSAEAASSLAELRRLSETAGAKVVAEYSQALERFFPATLIGSGKVLEVSRAACALGAKTVVFDMELAAAQQKNLEAALRTKVLDRTRLILDIFAKRARTNEGRLQVELAQLSYLLPRLTGAWRAFSQQVGGIGTRGPGERKLEYERRHIQRRIQHLKRELAKLERGRRLRRRRRLAAPLPHVALIGYTNVGKSSLLNRLMARSTGGGDGAVYADDKLFATLDPTTRRVRLPGGGWAVATDTVGFIQRLPTSLIAAFRSTLEEARLADCLLLVCDATATERDQARQDRAVEGILEELGARDIPRLRLYNKCDLLTPSQRRELLREKPNALLVCAATGEGVEAVLRLIETSLIC